MPRRAIPVVVFAVSAAAFLIELGIGASAARWNARLPIGVVVTMQAGAGAGASAVWSASVPAAAP